MVVLVGMPVQVPWGMETRAQITNVISMAMDMAASLLRIMVDVCMDGWNDDGYGDKWTTTVITDGRLWRKGSKGDTMHEDGHCDVVNSKRECGRW
ncbi:hypothetical protein GUJ93_ZPchr0011g27215 [Zizania palustris]|uniref:Uncharacterized protein n=1 Tax=Zizania palustris TaxID=103762 RepID=A0A8J6BPS7_ZIZPA|nr:hypothetical protein GUJ93_ZPchr0011g27215 [Zizania palustris]